MKPKHEDHCGDAFIDIKIEHRLKREENNEVLARKINNITSSLFSLGLF